MIDIYRTLERDAELALGLGRPDFGWRLRSALRGTLALGSEFGEDTKLDRPRRGVLLGERFLGLDGERNSRL